MNKYLMTFFGIAMLITTTANAAGSCAIFPDGTVIRCPNGAGGEAQYCQLPIGQNYGNGTCIGLGISLRGSPKPASGGAFGFIGTIVDAAKAVKNIFNAPSAENIARYAPTRQNINQIMPIRPMPTTDSATAPCIPKTSDNNRNINNASGWGFGCGNDWPGDHPYDNSKSCTTSNGKNGCDWLGNGECTEYNRAVND